jgi:3-oxoacyl-[acyl-carrier-protein] synthase III
MKQKINRRLYNFDHLDKYLDDALPFHIHDIHVSRPKVRTLPGQPSRGLFSNRPDAPGKTDIADRIKHAMERRFDMSTVRILGTGSFLPPKVLTNFDLIIVATITPDTCCPSSANWLQAKLEAPHAVSFDVTAACSGFIFVLNVAEQYLKAGASKNTLVVASEVMTRTLNWQDRSTCILWGDGAGAAVLSLGGSGHELLSTHGIDIHDIDWFIPHQANIRMFQYISESLKIPFEKFYLTLEKYGNISSASCAIALDEAIRDQSIQPDELICLPVFGGGLTWGSALIRW